MTFSTSSLTVESSATMEPKKSILCLPNEILSEIFENLPSKDREIVGALHGRLEGIEKRTGCRDFSTICFSTIDKPEIVARDVNANKFRKSPSEEGLANFFRRSTCRSLFIEGPLTIEHEQSIRSAFKSVDFKELRADFKGDYSGRILTDLLRGRSDIEQLHIGGSRWMIEKEVEEARRALMTIPTARRLNIAASSGKIISDSVLTHLVSISHYTDLGGVKETAITAEGLERAFEMVSAAPHYKEVSCSVPATAVHQFLDQRQSQFAVVFRTNLQNIATGTKFNYRLDRDNQDYLYVSIQSDKAPVPM